MNNLIKEANNSSIKLTKTFPGWSNGYLSRKDKDQTLRGAILELLQFLTYAKEIAKSDVAWNDEIIAWDAKLETLNNNSLL